MIFMSITKKMMLALLLAMPLHIDAQTIDASLFGVGYKEALTAVEKEFGKPNATTEGNLYYSKTLYEGLVWDEVFFLFDDGKLSEVRMYKRQSRKANAVQSVKAVARVMGDKHAMTRDLEDDGTPFYKGGKSPLDVGHLFTIYASPYKGAWSTQLRFGPFAFRKQ